MLERFYQVDHESRLVMTESLLCADQLKIESSPAVWQAISMTKANKSDLPDCLITKLDESTGCEVVYTFDKIAAKRAGMRLLK